MRTQVVFALLLMLAFPNGAVGQDEDTPPPETVDSVLGQHAAQAAQVELDSAHFDRLISATIRRARATFPAAAGALGTGQSRTQRGAERAARYRTIAVRAPSLSQDNATAFAHFVSGGIQAGVDGAEAGLQIAPFWTLGRHLEGLTVRIAGSTDAEVAYGISYALTDLDEPASLADLGLRCNWSDQHAPGIEAAASRVRPAFVEICENFVAVEIVDDASCNQNCRGMRALARQACGLEDAPADVSVQRAMDDLRTWLGIQRGAMQRRGGVRLDALNVLRHRYRAAIELASVSFRTPRPDDCVTENRVADAVAVRDRSRLHWRIAVGGDMRWFGIVFGHEAPDGDAGAVRRYDARLATLFRYDRVEVGFGATARAERENRDDDLTASLGGTASIAYLIASPSDFLGETRPARETWPSLTLGVDLSFRYALSPPLIQRTQLQEFDTTIRVAFQIAKELSFNLGIPIRGRIVESDVAINRAEWPILSIHYSW